MQSQGMSLFVCAFTGILVACLTRNVEAQNVTDLSVVQYLLDVSPAALEYCVHRRY